MKQHYGSDWAKDQAEGFYYFYTFYHDLIIQEVYRNIRFWYDVDHYFTPCIALAACFYWFYVKHFELQLLYEMCYINKVLLTYLLPQYYPKLLYEHVALLNVPLTPLLTILLP